VNRNTDIVFVGKMQCNTSTVAELGEQILPVILYGCETWSLTLREERRLRVFENRVLGLRGTR
jgi:hypothetical protein